MYGAANGAAPRAGPSIRGPAHIIGRPAHIGPVPHGPLCENVMGRAGPRARKFENVMGRMGRVEPARGNLKFDGPDRADAHDVNI